MTLYSDGELSVIWLAAPTAHLIVCEKETPVEGARVWMRTHEGEESFNLTDAEGRLGLSDRDGNSQDSLEVRVRWLKRSGSGKGDIIAAGQVAGILPEWSKTEDGYEKREVVSICDGVEAFFDKRGEEIRVALISSEYITAGIELAIGILSDGRRQLLYRGKTGIDGVWRTGVREESTVSKGDMVELVLLSQPEPVE